MVACRLLIAGLCVVAASVTVYSADAGKKPVDSKTHATMTKKEAAPVSTSDTSQKVSETKKTSAVNDSSTGSSGTMLTLTLSELAKYNGLNGAKAYVAVDGVIYDETGEESWKTGMHKGGNAGTDITAKIKKSPHGMAVLKKRPIVGKLVVEPKAAPTSPASKN